MITISLYFVYYCRILGFSSRQRPETSLQFRRGVFMNYRDYQSARDAAWQILLDCGVDRLPVRTSAICRQLGIRLIEDDIPQDGYSTIVDGIPYIVVKKDLYLPRKRFTAAHEIGHIVLGHVGRYHLVNREPSAQDNPIEQAANMFAARLLAPACVLWALDAHTPEQIMEVCGISKQSATFRARRMELLYQRNRFLSSPLERGLYQQFSGFIRHHQQASSDRA